MDWGWTSGFVIALVALAVGIVSVPHRPPFRVAKVCFLASACILAGKDVSWGAMTTLAPIIRVPAVGAIAAFAAIMLVEGWRWVGEAQAANTPGATRGHQQQQPSGESTKPSVKSGHSIHSRTSRSVSVSATAQPEASLGMVVHRAPQTPTGVVGMDVEGHNQGSGNAAYEINSHGTPEAPSTGAEVTAHGQSGQNVTGLRVTQSGPGTGLRIVQSGSGTGLRVTVSDQPPAATNPQK